MSDELMLMMGGRRMLIEPLSGRLWEHWIHLRDAEDVALCGKQGLRPASGQEAYGARGTCPDCTRVRDQARVAEIAQELELLIPDGEAIIFSREGYSVEQVRKLRDALAAAEARVAALEQERDRLRQNIEAASRQVKREGYTGLAERLAALVSPPAEETTA